MDWAHIRRRIDAYERLMRLDKPIGTLLLLWPTLWAVWLAAKGNPRFDVVLIFFCGTVLMRAAGVIVNDVADRGFDAAVARTRNRPLATGEVGVREALVLAAVLALAAFALVLFLNRYAIALSLVALALAVSYPFFKRFFALPQAWLGIAFGFGIPMAYAATLNALPPVCWALLAANILWAIAYDTEYAMVDRDDDLKIGIRTSAITFGRFDVLAVMLCYGAMLAVLAGIGAALRLNWPYYIGLAMAAVLMGYHYRLIRTRSREGCFMAFLHNNWVGASIFAGIVLSYPVLLPWN